MQFPNPDSIEGQIIDLSKDRDSHYLLVKLNARDRKYLDGFREHETKNVAGNTGTYFRSMISIHTKALFVMQTAMILEDKKMAGPPLINTALFQHIQEKLVKIR